jgi:hypothetical protein
MVAMKPYNANRCPFSHATLAATCVTMLVMPFTVLPFEGWFIFTAAELAVFTVTDALLTCRP